MADAAAQKAAMERRREYLEAKSLNQPRSLEYEADEVMAGRGQEYKATQKAVDPYAQEVGPGAAMVRRLDTFLGENVVEPMANAGWPNLGAGLATIPTVVADMVIPQTAGDFAAAPISKIGKAAKAAKGAKVAEKAAAEQIVKQGIGRPQPGWAVSHSDYAAPTREGGFTLRIMNDEGRGPFSPEMQKHWRDPKNKNIVGGVQDNAIDSRVWDMVEEAPQGQFLYGFTDEKQMNKYLTKAEMERLKELGFTPRWVKSKASWDGKTQSLFEPDWDYE